MTGFGVCSGMNGVDYSLWTKDELLALRDVINSLIKKKERDENAANNALGSTDRGENCLYGLYG